MKITKEATFDVDVYEVTIDGVSMPFDSNVDLDGDISIELDEGSVVDYVFSHCLEGNLTALFDSFDEEMAKEFINNYGVDKILKLCSI